MTFLLLIFLALSPFQTADTFTAKITKSEAVFSMPVEARDKWTWHRPDTRPNQREYRIDVTLKNEGNEYTFGFYLWKKPDAKQGSGNLKDLISAGQKSLFVRSESRLMTIIHEADIKVKVKDNDRVEIVVNKSNDLKRLFSGHPTEAIFKIKYPDAPEVSRTVAIVYQ